MMDVREVYHGEKWSIWQDRDDREVKIACNGTVKFTLTGAKKNMSIQELEKILHLYQISD